jgi:hypothetical protein
MAHTDTDTTLKFDYNGLATWPYSLRYTRVLDFYTGDALMVDGHPVTYSRYLYVPPNVAAIVLLGENRVRVLAPGRYHLGTELREGQPVSVQFVNLAAHSFEVDFDKKGDNTDRRIPTKDHLLMGLTLWVTVKVIDPVRVVESADPIEDVKNLIGRQLVSALRDLAHGEAVRLLPSIVERILTTDLKEHFSEHGLQVKISLSRLRPDPDWENLERRNTLVDRAGYVERREAQKDEDVAAFKQPANRRSIMGQLQAQTRERNQQARMEAIETVKELAKALVEDLRRHPGRVFTEKDMQPLEKALDLLDKLAAPVSPPPIPQQVRSYFAVDAGDLTRAPIPPPPALPDTDELPVPPGSVWDKSKGNST